MFIAIQLGQHIFRSLSLNPITDHSYYKRRSCGLVDLVKTKNRAPR